MDRKTENEIARFFQKRVRERVLYLMNSKNAEIFSANSRTTPRTIWTAL